MRASAHAFVRPQTWLRIAPQLPQQPMPTALAHLLPRQSRCTSPLPIHPRRRLPHTTRPTCGQSLTRLISKSSIPCPKPPTSTPILIRCTSGPRNRRHARALEEYCQQKLATSALSHGTLWLIPSSGARFQGKMRPRGLAHLFAARDLCEFARVFDTFVNDVANARASGSRPSRRNISRT